MYQYIYIDKNIYRFLRVSVFTDSPYLDSAVLLAFATDISSQILRPQFTTQLQVEMKL